MPWNKWERGGAADFSQGCESKWGGKETSPVRAEMKRKRRFQYTVGQILDQLWFVPCLLWYFFSVCFVYLVLLLALLFCRAANGFCISVPLTSKKRYPCCQLNSAAACTQIQVSQHWGEALSPPPITPQLLEPRKGWARGLHPIPKGPVHEGKLAGCLSSVDIVAHPTFPYVHETISSAYSRKGLRTFYMRWICWESHTPGGVSLSPPGGWLPWIRLDLKRWLGRLST